MNASQRLADVKKLRDDVCHGFLKLILVPGWQNALYNMATQEVTNNGRFRDAYSETYTKMRAKGASNYTVDDMDVSIMRTVASFWNSRSNSGTNFSPMKQNTLDALKNVKEDRNIGGHSSSNEDEEELYLQGLLSLINLQQFIKAVDNKRIDFDFFSGSLCPSLDFKVYGINHIFPR